ncbi:hypothetical protein DIPPA_19895 [Diplonema papillatum]|nr:hypothetical protein DIPPA_19897 [Diplonema papillatum]KAJ9461576.1 hypothetical protein DIPPA_19895 [Diplonema papillatum]
MPVAVVDGGSHTTKVGLAGEALPWAVLPSSYGEVVEAAAGGAPRARRYWGRAGLERQRGPLTVGNPYGEEGQVRDFELWAELAASGIAAARLGTVDTIVVTERPWAAEWHSERLVDALFNHLADTTRVAVVKQPSAGAGAENCLIVDAGHSQTTVSPVFGAASVPPPSSAPGTARRRSRRTRATCRSLKTPEFQVNFYSRKRQSKTRNDRIFKPQNPAPTLVLT